MKNRGYFRTPAIHGDRIVFVSEDDLWTVPAQGGLARRLTSGLGSARFPSFSPDGRSLAFTGREEGPGEVYVMPSEGGPATRLTFTGNDAAVIGWLDATTVIFASSHETAFLKIHQLYKVATSGGAPELLPTGPAGNICFGSGGARVIERRGIRDRDPAHWKRYRGGTASELWIDPNGSGAWRKLLNVEGHASRPVWLGGRVYFVADHEGIGNLYSCLPTGKDVKRHTSHTDFYVRNPSGDGKRIVYHAGGDLHVFDPHMSASTLLEIEYASPRTQRNRKFADSARHLEDFELDSTGKRLALSARGRAFTLGCFDGPAIQQGLEDARYSFPRWLGDGKRLLAYRALPAHASASLEILDAEGLREPAAVPCDEARLGRPHAIQASPDGKFAAIANHRNELIVVELASGRAILVEKPLHRELGGMDWSPDSQWLAYSAADGLHVSVIKLFHLPDETITRVTQAVGSDVAPAFDPDGRYLYFVSYREFDPVYDSLQFELGFPRGSRPYLLTLRRDVPSPFAPAYDQLETEQPDEKGDKKTKAPPFSIDLEGIENRIVAFPVAEGRYAEIAGLPGGKVLFTSLPIEGALSMSWFETEPSAKAALECYDFSKRRSETLLGGVTTFALSGDRKKICVRMGNRLRVLPAGEKPSPEADAPSADGRAPEGRKDAKLTGWVNLGRVRLSVQPVAEWKQMLHDAWALQRDHFWDERMSSVDWNAAYERYAPLLDRVSCRSELSDLILELQGELGTSHAYEMGGDYREPPRYDVGFLGAELSWDAKARAYRIERLLQGDPWDTGASSPLLRPGLGISADDLLLSVNGRKLSATTHPLSLLVHQAGAEVQLGVADAEGKNRRTIQVKTLVTERNARYRDWVRSNRDYIHQRSGGRVGYVHVPDMGPKGFSEFHRSYLAECDRDALVIDVRYNGGGHVSQLLLEKLARKRIAFCQSRWLGVFPYPDASPAGPLVAVTNEYAGSDGDIFSHGFKMMKLGPLVGKRTWGGVVGINARSRLADGGITTQPEYAFWFRDVGYQIENRGAEPDIEVEFRPQDFVAGIDPQLDRALRELQKLMKQGKTGTPDFGKRPVLAAKVRFGTGAAKPAPSSATKALARRPKAPAKKSPAPAALKRKGAVASSSARRPHVSAVASSSARRPHVKR
jgi:tricorn protease